MTYPQDYMKDAATALIADYGTDVYFKRGAVLSTTAITVHLQPANTVYQKTKLGLEDIVDYLGFAKHDADIQKGDFVSLSGGEYSADSGTAYYEVYTLEDWGTHLRFTLRETREEI